MSLDLFNESPAKPTRNFDDEFETLWVAYPKRPGNPKAAAKAVFMSLAKNGHLLSAEKMMQATRAFAKAIARDKTEPKFIPHMRTWLTQRRFIDFAPAVEAPGSAVVDTTEVPASWARAKEQFIKRYGAGMWMQYFAGATFSEDARIVTFVTEFSASRVFHYYGSEIRAYLGFAFETRGGGVTFK